MGMMNSGITAAGSVKSGRIDSLPDTSGLVSRPLRPPTSGWPTATTAAAIDPARAVKKSRKSVSSTPVRPPRAANATVTPPATTIVQSGGTPSRMPAILMAASVTVAMIMTLKNTPRYTALKPRRNAAGLPP
jgi:hypothetical protein